jgi:hypothetical protein
MTEIRYFEVPYTYHFTAKLFSPPAVGDASFNYAVGCVCAISIIGLLYLSNYERSNYKSTMKQKGNLATDSESFFYIALPKLISSDSWCRRVFLKLAHENSLLMAFTRVDQDPLDFYEFRRLAGYGVFSCDISTILLLSALIFRFLYADDGYCQSLSEKNICIEYEYLSILYHPCHWNNENAYCYFDISSFDGISALLLLICTSLCMLFFRMIFRKIAEYFLCIINSALRTVSIKNGNLSAKSLDLRRNKNIYSSMSPFLQTCLHDVSKQQLLKTTLLLAARLNISQLKIDFLSIEEEIEAMWKRMDILNVREEIKKIDELKVQKSELRSENPDRFKAKCQKVAPFIVQNYPGVLVKLLLDDEYRFDMNEAVKIPQPKPFSTSTKSDPFVDYSFVGSYDTASQVIQYVKETGKDYVQKRYLKTAREAANILYNQSNHLSLPNKEYYLLRSFCVYSCSWPVLLKYSREQILEPCERQSKKISATRSTLYYLSTVLLFLYPLGASFFAFYLGSRIGSKSVIYLLLFCFVELILEFAIFQIIPAVRFTVFNDIFLRPEMLRFMQLVQARSKIVLTRKIGLIDHYNSLIQHFNPACRAARLTPTVGVSRLLMSFSDFDLPFRTLFGSTSEFLMKFVLLIPQVVSDLAFLAALYGMAIGLYYVAPYQFPVIFLVFVIAGVAVIYIGSSDSLSKDDATVSVVEKSDFEDDDEDDEDRFVDLEILQKPSPAAQKPSIVVDLFNKTPYYLPEKSPPKVPTFRSEAEEEKMANTDSAVYKPGLRDGQFFQEFSLATLWNSQDQNKVHVDESENDDRKRLEFVNKVRSGLGSGVSAVSSRRGVSKETPLPPIAAHRTSSSQQQYQTAMPGYLAPTNNVITGFDLNKSSIRSLQHLDRDRHPSPTLSDVPSFQQPRSVPAGTVDENQSTLPDFQYQIPNEISIEQASWAQEHRRRRRQFSERSLVRSVSPGPLNDSVIAASDVSGIESQQQSRSGSRRRRRHPRDQFHYTSRGVHRNRSYSGRNEEINAGEIHQEFSQFSTAFSAWGGKESNAELVGVRPSASIISSSDAKYTEKLHRLVYEIDEEF